MSDLDEMTRRKYLEEMGITVWSSRALQNNDEPEVAEQAKAVSSVTQNDGQPSKPETGFVSPNAGPDIPLPEPLPVEAFADSFPSFPVEEDLPAVTGSEPSGPATVPAAGDTWEGLLDEINHCGRCHLCKTRNKVVPGTGDRNADWLFVGEGPGFHEDQQGEPFVGRSGKLLDSMMAAMQMKRGDNVYIANVVKCRATNEFAKDRQPTEEEAAFCMPYLERQIELIKPKIMVALGKTAACALLNTGREVTLGSLRNRTHTFRVAGRKIPLIVTYHPSYLLRTPGGKKQAWQDMCTAMDIVDEEMKKEG